MTPEAMAEGARNTPPSIEHPAEWKLAKYILRFAQVRFSSIGLCLLFYGLRVPRSKQVTGSGFFSCI